MYKYITGILTIVVIMTIGFISCKKSGTLIFATEGTVPKLTASTTTLSYTQADSTKPAITFTYSLSDYGYQAALNYDLEFSYNDSNFSSFKNYTLNKDTLSKPFTVADFNNLLISLNFAANVKDTLFVRVRALVNGTTTGNNPLVKYSDTIQIIIKPYSQIPIPVITPPDSLYIIGDATPGGWSNPVPIPSQKFTQLDKYGQVFGMILRLNAGGTFVFLPKNGSWDHKYGGKTAGSGTLLVDNDVPGSNTPGPATAGLYEIIVDFVKATYSVTPVTTNNIPTHLYIVGDATPGGWANPVPVPSQKFIQVSNAEFQLKISLMSTGTYLLLPTNDNVWSVKYGGTGAEGGALLYNGDVPGSNTPAPTESGTYLMDVNFLANTYMLKKQ